jgi:hypothetical protein
VDSRPLGRAVRNRVRESLVREEVRANQSELMGAVPSEAAIVDAAAARRRVVRSHRSDIAGLRQAAAGGSPPSSPPTVVLAMATALTYQQISVRWLHLRSRVSVSAPVSPTTWASATPSRCYLCSSCSAPRRVASDKAQAQRLPTEPKATPLPV